MTSCKDRVKTADNIIEPTQDAKASSMTETTENVNTTQTVMPTSESTASNENLQIPVTSETQENDVLISPIAILTADYKYSNIFLADSDGKLIRKITENNFNNFAPELAPAGDKIAFYSDMDGDFDIYTVNTDGTDLKNITDNKSQDYMPKWSKDGRKICYYSDEPGNTDIYIINIDGTQNQQIVKNNSENYGAIWSKDYSEIFYVSNEAGSFDIYSIGIDGSQKIKLTDDEYFEESLSLSQDGNKILYSSGQIDNTVFEVHSFDLNSLESHQLTNNMSYGRIF